MRKTAIQICLVICDDLCFIQAQENVQKAINFNDRGVEQVNAEKYEAAINHSIQAINLHPNYPTGLL
jgi:hypothetical protein